MDTFLCRRAPARHWNAICYEQTFIGDGLNTDDISNIHVRDIDSHDAITMITDDVERLRRRSCADDGVFGAVKVAAMTDLIVRIKIYVDVKKMDDCS